MKRRAPEIPAEQRHRIVPDGDRFALVTHTGYVLKTFDTRAEAEQYYSVHCPADIGR